MGFLHDLLRVQAKLRRFGIRLRSYLYVDILHSESVLISSFQKFYFRGLKLVVTHRRQAKAIQARVNAGGEPLSRWESRFIQTNKSDLARYSPILCKLCYSSSDLSRLRLVPFVAIVLVLEEVIPLIVLYAPGMLPSTCILASQRERIDAKRREKQRSYAETMPDAFFDVLKAGPEALASSLPSTISSIGLCGKVNFGVTDRGTRLILFSAQSLVSVNVGSQFPT